jgi:hypothetical protein
MAGRPATLDSEYLVIESPSALRAWELYRGEVSGTMTEACSCRRNRSTMDGGERGEDGWMDGQRKWAWMQTSGTWKG